MIEDQLRATFARHEREAPGTAELRRGIEARTAQRRRRRATAVAGSLAAVVAVLVVAVSLTVRAIGPVTPSLPDLAGAVPNRALNFLVLGLDDAPGVPAGHRADSITVVHVSADRQRLYLVDFERDLVVDIPGHGRGKINGTYPLGGAALTATVVAGLTGVTLDGVVTLTTTALSGLVDAVGGVDVCLPHGFTSIHTGQTYPTGCASLDGAQAADVVRQRSSAAGDPDSPQSLPLGAYERDGNIERVMAALVHRAASLSLFTDATTIAGLLTTAGLTVDLPGISLVALAAELAGRDGGDVVGVVSPSFQPTQIDGIYQGEQLDPTVTPDLFAALRDDTLDQFATTHPDWLVS